MAYFIGKAEQLSATSPKGGVIPLATSSPEIQFISFLNFKARFYTLIRQIRFQNPKNILLIETVMLEKYVMYLRL
jgi:hypothetical protein